MSFRSLFAFFVLIMVSACRQETAILEEENTFSGVDSRLESYFELFENEAAARGIDVDLATEGITAVVEEISEDRVAGTCTYGSHLPGHIVIDAEFWNIASPIAKEMVIFHELGHCYLHRGHTEATFSNGTCASIMRSGAEGCRDNYNTRTREFYIDELFGVY